MDSQEIAVRGWKCSKCGRVDTNKALIDSCCTERKCEDCGKLLPHNWYSTRCTPCREKLLFDNAEHMTWDEYQEKYPGNMIVMGDNYYSDIFEAMERWDDDCYPDEPDEDERPKYVWGTHKEYMRVDADYAIENATEDAYEDADFPDKARKELFDMIEKWNDKYEQVYYSENNKVAVIIPWEKFNV